MDFCVQSFSYPCSPAAGCTTRAAIIAPRRSNHLSRYDQFYARSLNEYGKDLASEKCGRPKSVRMMPSDHASLVIEF